MRGFQYVDPDDIPGVLAILAAHGPDARLLAGGQSLLILLRQRLVLPAVVVGLRTVAGLRDLELRPDGALRVGAMVTYRQVAASEDVLRAAPLLARAAGHVGSMHIRELGTVGGAACHADPAGDVPVALMALDARYVHEGQAGRAEEDTADFATGLFETRLPDDSLLTAALVPRQPPGSRTGYARFLMREGEYPMTQCAVRLEMADGVVAGARLAVGGGGDRPQRLQDLEQWLVGTTPDPRLLAELQERVTRSVKPYPDVRGSAEWKAHVIGVIARRAMEDALSP
jgi:carbon-monoxide dehydrogenase medium subunit